MYCGCSCYRPFLSVVALQDEYLEHQDLIVGLTAGFGLSILFFQLFFEHFTEDSLPIDEIIEPLKGRIVRIDLLRPEFVIEKSYFTSFFDALMDICFIQKCFEVP
jgi:hypothetical protein